MSYQWLTRFLEKKDETSPARFVRVLNGTALATSAKPRVGGVVQGIDLPDGRYAVGKNGDLSRVGEVDDMIKRGLRHLLEGYEHATAWGSVEGTALLRGAARVQSIATEWPDSHEAHLVVQGDALSVVGVTLEALVRTDIELVDATTAAPPVISLNARDLLAALSLWGRYSGVGQSSGLVSYRGDLTEVEKAHLKRLQPLAKRYMAIRDNSNHKAEQETLLADIRALNAAYGVTPPNKRGCAVRKDSPYHKAATGGHYTAPDKGTPERVSLSSYRSFGKQGGYCYLTLNPTHWIVVSGHHYLRREGRLRGWEDPLEARFAEV